VLIPRPETELLVEQALQWLTAHPGSKWVVDVGTGSGCIAVALAVHAPGLRLLASDISPAALRVASGNARRHAVDSRIDFVLSDLLPAVGVSLDLLCANLPYIPSPELGTLKAARREPLLALDGGSDGLNLLQRLLGLAQDVLSEHALLLLEIGAYQGAAAARLAQTVFPRARVEILPDLAGNDRLLCIERVSLSI
jgi:release factor glutamine methyltransferase